MVLADKGSDNFVSGAHDPRWDADVLRQLKRVTTMDVEVVEMKGLVVSTGAGSAAWARESSPGWGSQNAP